MYRVSAKDPRQSPERLPKLFSNTTDLEPRDLLQRGLSHSRSKLFSLPNIHVQQQWDERKDDVSPFHSTTHSDFNSVETSSFGLSGTPSTAQSHSDVTSTFAQSDANQAYFYLNTPYPHSPLSPGVIDTSRRKSPLKAPRSFFQSPTTPVSTASSSSERRSLSGAKKVSFSTEIELSEELKFEDQAFFTEETPVWVKIFIDQLIEVYPQYFFDTRFLNFFSWCLENLLNFSMEDYEKLNRTRKLSFTRKGPQDLRYAEHMRGGEFCAEDMSHLVNDMIVGFLKILIQNHKFLDGIDLSYLKLSEISFSEGISMRNVKFIESTLDHIDFNSIALARSNFTGAKISSALFLNCDLSHSVFCFSELFCVNFLKANFSYSRFIESKIVRSELSQSVMTEVFMEKSCIKESDLSYSFLENSKMIRTQFENTKMKSLQLSEKRPSGVEFCFSTFKNVDMSQSNLMGSKFEFVSLDFSQCVSVNFSHSSFRNASTLKTNFSCANFAFASDLTFLEGLETAKAFEFP